MPMQSAKSKTDALRFAFDAMEMGADFYNLWYVEPRLYRDGPAKAGIPAEGHLGLVPRRSTWTGGLRAVGKTIEQAKKLFDEFKNSRKCGCMGCRN